MSDIHEQNGREFVSSRESFDEVYEREDFSDAAGIVSNHRAERAPFLRLLVDRLKATGEAMPRVLEVGCGTAADLVCVREDTSCVTTGVDVSREALRVAARTSDRLAEGVELVQGDGYCLPFASGVFDLVFSQGVLEHLTADLAAVAEQVRVLKPGGDLVISVPQKYTVYTIMKHIRIKKGTWPWGYEREYASSQLTDLGARARVEQVAVQGCGYWLHPLEPMWVLRSLAGKARKINPFRGTGLCRRLHESYERMWGRVEQRWGHLFMLNTVIVLKKQKRGAA